MSAAIVLTHWPGPSEACTQWEFSLVIRAPTKPKYASREATLAMQAIVASSPPGSHFFCCVRDLRIHPSSSRALVLFEVLMVRSL